MSLASQTKSNKGFVTERLDILRDRARMLAAAREFFKERSVIEVDCPLLSQAASVDAHIDLIPAMYEGSEMRFLHSSPEFGMKRLLAEGLGDIYQLSHVFRDGELGPIHSPEFMMCEWYRLGFSFEDIIDDTLAFIRLFVGDPPSVKMSYRTLFQRYADLDPYKADERLLALFLKKAGIDAHLAGDEGDRDNLLNLILGCVIQPALEKASLVVVTHFPASQAALAKTTTVDGCPVAERFEVFYKGVELANGYHELADAQEQRRRLDEANETRKKMGKETLPIDELFLAALGKGLPPCCGVAVGVDRLLMLRHNKKLLADIVPHPWTLA